MSFSWRAHDDAHSPEPKRLPWKDYAPPEAQAVDAMIAHFRPQSTGPRHCIPITEPESEVMPADPQPTSERVGTEQHDTRPASATRANRLDQIATLVRMLTYGEMMDLAAALWKAHDETSQEDELTEKDLPGMWHRWAKEDIKP